MKCKARTALAVFLYIFLSLVIPTVPYRTVRPGCVVCLCSQLSVLWLVGCGPVGPIRSRALGGGEGAREGIGNGDRCQTMVCTGYDECALCHARPSPTTKNKAGNANIEESKSTVPTPSFIPTTLTHVSHSHPAHAPSPLIPPLVCAVHQGVLLSRKTFGFAREVQCGYRVLTVLCCAANHGVQNVAACVRWSGEMEELGFAAMAGWGSEMAGDVRGGWGFCMKVVGFLGGNGFALIWRVVISVVEVVDCRLEILRGSCRWNLLSPFFLVCLHVRVTVWPSLFYPCWLLPRNWVAWSS